MTVRHAVTHAATGLAVVSDTPRLDAELLMAHALGVERDALLLRHLDDPVPRGFVPLIERRLSNEPIAYITGNRDFWTVRIAVAPGVLIPRPDSEVLIEAAVAHFHTDRQLRILDLGTGPGTLLLAALATFPAATGLGIDASNAAVDLARTNGDRIAPGRAVFRLGNWAEGIDERFDLILCNPPYVEADAVLDAQVRDWEPAEALFAGYDGLDAYRALIPHLSTLVEPGGMIAVEIGHTQAQAVSALFVTAGLLPELRHDLADRPRAIIHFALGNPVESV